MKCPNCGAPYSGHETICKNCNLPLGNADYTPIKSHSSRRKKYKKKKKKLWPLLILLLLIIIGGGICGYFYYISQVKKNCEEATKEIFSYAKNMDFSAIDPSYLPKELQDNPDIKNQIQNHVEETIKENGLDTMLKLAQIEIDSDQIREEIIKSASYEITDISANYHSCTVTVHTENVDFSKLPEAISEKANSLLGESDSLWEGIKNLFHYIFSDETDEDTFSENLSQWYEEAKASAPKKETTGTITYGKKDEEWVLLDIDENLFYSYYGIDSSIFDSK